MAQAAYLRAFLRLMFEILLKHRNEEDDCLTNNAEYYLQIYAKYFSC